MKSALLPISDLPALLASYIIGAGVSALGVVATTMAGWYTKLATIDPQELAIQPLHVVLIGFIIALAGFIVLILRAVWGKGLSTVDKFSGLLEDLIKKIEKIFDTQNERLAKLEKLENLGLDALRESVVKARQQQEK